MVDHRRAVSSWVDDHLTCAALGRWLPTWSRDAATCVLVRGRAPGRLHALLASLDVDGAERFEQLVVAAALSDRNVPWTTALQGRAADDAAHGDLRVLDVAWIGSWRARAGLWGWRREPVRVAMAGRLARMADAGLDRLQQWVAFGPVPCVITIGRLRAASDVRVAG